MDGLLTKMPSENVQNDVNCNKTSLVYYRDATRTLLKGGGRGLKTGKNL